MGVMDEPPGNEGKDPNGDREPPGQDSHQDPEDLTKAEEAIAKPGRPMSHKDDDGAGQGHQNGPLKKAADRLKDAFKPKGP